MSNSVHPILTVTSLAKSFKDTSSTVNVLENVSLTVGAGESIAIMGASGSGKTTLLQLLGGLDVPDSGTITLDDQMLGSLSEAALSRLRNEKLGFVYQFHHLLPEFTALENTMMPLLIRGTSICAAKAQASAILEKVGLSHRLDHKPAQLSGGERQRCAIARALITRPLCVLADEPTGNLDKHTAEHVFALMTQLQRETNTSFIIATHDTQLAAQMDSCYMMDSGVLRRER